MKAPVLNYIWIVSVLITIMLLSILRAYGIINVKSAKELEVARKKAERKTEDKKSQEYELVYILTPEISDEALETRVNNITQFITGKDGTIIGVDKWGKKKLAYPIKHFLEGNYVLAKFKMSPSRCKELEANLRISEDIVRHLLINVGS